MRPLAFVPVLLAAAAPLAAQTSQFGARALGQPGRAMSARDAALGGASAPTSAETALNPATAGLNGVTVGALTVLQDRNQLQNVAGTGQQDVMRFPHLLLGGPIPGTRFSLGVSLSSYLVRDIGFVSRETITLRGQPVEVTDSLVARGGVGDIQVAGAWRFSGQALVGVGVHFLTGSDRVVARRTFADDAFLPATQRQELAFGSNGVSVGVWVPAGRRFAASAHARFDSPLRVEANNQRVATYRLPVTVGAGLAWRSTTRLGLFGAVQHRTWSRANDQLVAAGSPSRAFNATEVALGAEYSLLDRRRTWRFPLRLGTRYGTLPFGLTAGAQPKEFGLSAGTGTRFAGQRASVDLSAERVVRWDGAGRRDRALLVGVTLTIRP